MLQPQRSDFLPFHKATIGDEEINEVVAAIKSGWLTSGPRVRLFEDEFAQAVGARHAIAVNSCTAALHLAVESLGIKEGDEVLVPSMTFTATAEVVSYLKARPVLVDVDRNTQLIDVQDLEKKISAKTRAIMPVHVAGFPCDLDRIREIQSRYKNIVVIEDAAHAFPASYKGKKIGGISEATCFSFYATKTITTGEGGMLTTNDDEIACRTRIMRTHGINRDAFSRSGSKDPWIYDVIDAGYKYNLTDPAAAMGLIQLKRAEEMRSRREKIAQIYQKEFSGSRHFLLPAESSTDAIPSWHLYTLRLNLDSLKISRNEFARILRELNIGTSVHWIPLHQQPFYKTKWNYRDEDLPNASWLSSRILSLPLFPDMSDKDIFDVVETVNLVANANAR